MQDRGSDPNTGQPYPSRHDDSREIRTAREAAIVTLLDHPYICGMRDVIKTNNHWYMLCEYVNGGQMLDYIISHGRLKEKQARKFGRQIASALDYCHRNSIVHRDLKIENILISKTGDIKIIDFGLSNLFSPRAHLRTFCGSLYFAAPELLQARQYIGPEVDVWSFGIVLYVLVCGKVPFDDQNMPALHAKIKRGVVEYPQWLSNGEKVALIPFIAFHFPLFIFILFSFLSFLFFSFHFSFHFFIYYIFTDSLPEECRNLLSRMLVTEPKNRASLLEIMTHPWLLKGFSGPPENYLPHREPLTLPLDPTVIDGMTGFEFGSSEVITAQLTKLIGSEDYQMAVKQALRDAPSSSAYPDRKKTFAFDFYKRRASTSSKDTLINPSSEALAPYTTTDPVNAYNPLVSVYYLVREKLERDGRNVAAGSQAGALASVDTEKPSHLAPRQPEVAHTGEMSYELAGGVPLPTSGRTRPRARTHGDDEVTETIKNADLGASVPVTPTGPPQKTEQPPIRRDLSVGGMLRRLSTRRHHSCRGDSKGGDSGSSSTAKGAPPPTLSLQPPDEAPVNLMRKSLSVRRAKDTFRPPTYANSSQSGQPDLLTPPTTADATSAKKPTKPLGRSTSVSEVDWRRKYTRPRSSLDPPGTSGSERSVAGRAEGGGGGGGDNPFAVRAKSVGHGKRDGAQSRRLRRDEMSTAATAGRNLDDAPADDNAEVATSAGSGDAAVSSTPSADFVKPVYLKGLFSVQTTSTKPPLDIRGDIIRVLEQLGVSYKEIKGGFFCVHRPSIDLKSVVEDGGQSAEATNMVSPSSHRRKLSYGTSGGSKNQGSSKQQSSRRDRADTSYSNSDASNESVNDGVLGGSLILQFEIYIVKVPLLALHGVQFKSVNKTNTWQYKSLASRILSELKL